MVVFLAICRVSLFFLLFHQKLYHPNMLLPIVIVVVSGSEYRYRACQHGYWIENFSSPHLMGFDLLVACLLMQMFESCLHIRKIACGSINLLYNKEYWEFPPNNFMLSTVDRINVIQCWSIVNSLWFSLHKWARELVVVVLLNEKYILYMWTMQD